MATASRPTDQPEDQLKSSLRDFLAGPSVDSSLDSPTLIDHRRYYASRAGRSVADLAKAAGVGEAEIELSIQKVRIDNERYSAAAAGVEARKLFFAALPKIGRALDEALSATKVHGTKVVTIDEQTGEAVITEETVERPDHDTRLRAIDSSRFILSVVQPRDPAVQIVSNSQTNILNQAAQPAGQLGAGLTSPEAVIREIVAQRQHALTSGNLVVSQPVAEGEVIEARVGLGSDLDEDDLEVEPGEDDEDEDEEDEDGEDNGKEAED
jgi:hypothetical protein